MHACPHCIRTLLRRAVDHAPRNHWSARFRAAYRTPAGALHVPALPLCAARCCFDVAVTAQACLLGPSRIRQKQAEAGGAARASVSRGSSGLSLSLYCWDPACMGRSGQQPAGRWRRQQGLSWGLVGPRQDPAWAAASRAVVPADEQQGMPHSAPVGRPLRGPGSHSLPQGRCKRQLAELSHG